MTTARMRWPAFNRCNPLARGLVAYWPMWEGPGSGTIGDVANPDPKVLRAALAGGMDPATAWKAGGPSGGHALDFDGSSYVDLGSNSLIKGITGAMTLVVMARGRSSSVNSLSAMGTENGSNNRGFSFGPNNSGDWKFAIPINFNTINVLSASLSVPTEWELWVGTYTPSVSQLLYKNGVLVASDFAGIPASQYIGSTQTVKIGRRGDSEAKFLGRISYVAIYSRALRPSEIQHQFERPNDLLSLRRSILPTAVVAGTVNPFSMGAINLFQGKLAG